MNHGMKGTMVVLSLFMAAVLFCQDGTSDITVKKEQVKKSESSFPGKLGIEFGQTFQLGNTGDVISKTAKSEDAIYSKTEFKAKVDFKISNIYSVTPWVKNRVEVYGAPGFALSAGSLVSDSAMTKVRFRDRFDFGFDNTIIAKDRIKVVLTPVFRLDSDFTKNVGDKVDSEKRKYGAAVGLIFMPVVTLGYHYSMGLSWEIINTFYFEFYPVMQQVSGNSVFERFGYEGKYTLAFDILKAMKVKDYGLSIFASDLFYIRFYSENYRSDAIVNGKNVRQAGDVDKNEFATGVSGKFYGVTLKANYYQKLKGNVYENCDAGINQWNGFQLTGEIAKSGWTFGVQYTGDIQTWKAASGTEGSRAVQDRDGVKWENTVEAYLKFKL